MNEALKEEPLENAKVDTGMPTLDQVLLSGVKCKPPINFGVVAPGVYRSGYPDPSAYEFLRSDVKTIVTLVSNEMPPSYADLIRRSSIRHHVFDMAGTKKAAIPDQMMTSIISVVNNPANYPLLIHCNHGKHRTGCVVGVYRKTQGKTAGDAVLEYKAYAEPKARPTDIEYIMNFDISRVPARVQTEGKSEKRKVAGCSTVIIAVVIFVLVCMVIMAC